MAGAGATGLAVLLCVCTASAPSGQHTHTLSPAEVGALFPGLAGLRAAQASKLRELLREQQQQQQQQDGPRAVQHYTTAPAHLPAHTHTAPPHTDETRPITNPPYTNRRPPEGADARLRRGEAEWEGEGPAVDTGPDLSHLTPRELQQAENLLSDMCARLAGAETVRVVATPLTPTPAPVAVAVSACAPAAPLVVGGAPVSARSHPHMAALGWPRLRAREFVWKCGGTLVSESHVLTAAHCSYHDRDTSVVAGAPRVVRLGAARLPGGGGAGGGGGGGGGEEERAVLVRVSRVVRHPQYRAPAAYYDIAVLLLSSPAPLSEFVRPACVGAPPAPGTDVVATGWGRTEYGGEMSEVLRGVTLSVRNMSECERALGHSRKLPRGAQSASQLCAGSLRDKDTCQGDSGGPLVVRGARGSCVWSVVGVTSLGRACGAAATPALYARPLASFVAAVVWPDELARRLARAL